LDFPFEYISYSEDDTITLAKNFVRELSEGTLVVLNGDLGTGKTFFIKCLLKNFNVTNAISPTFAIVNEYYGNKKFYHFDFYRINKKSELIDIGITDYFNDEKAIIFIEWGSMFEDILPSKRIEINIIYNPDNSRLFTFNKYE
jgi:tRNA threonylcarbamoyladenosine biosynthesis protein TsaE